MNTTLRSQTTRTPQPFQATGSPAAPARRSPRQFGYAMPAEWEPQEGIWLTWPANSRYWPGRFQNIPPLFAEVASLISRYERVFINAPGLLHEDIARLLVRAGGHLGRIRLHDHPADDVWCRDHGPIFVRHRGTGLLALTDWVFNGWGGKQHPHDNDNAIPTCVSASLGMPRFSFPHVLEGGAIEVNAAGQCLTSEAVLLNPNRAAGFGKTEIAEFLIEGLGLREILWLDEGIDGDDTDGHIDNFARFYCDEGILVSTCGNPIDPNYAVCCENIERLRHFRAPGGGSFELVGFPLPEPIFDGERRLAASYANFLVINGAVLVPSYDQPRNDRRALDIIAECFPDREILPVRCTDLVHEGGSLHCITQQQPAGGEY